MLILGIVYFIPAAIFIYFSYQDVKSKMSSKDSPVSVFTFGALIFKDKIKKGDAVKGGLEFAQRNDYMKVLLVVFLLAVLISFGWLIFLRKKLLEKALKLDEDIYTPSDFCIMGKNMKFENYNPSKIEEAIRENFKNKFEIDDIVYVNPVYDIADFYKIFNKQNELIKL